ncbi:hypothetical protein IC582_008418 [Cucumis melo]
MQCSTDSRGNSVPTILLLMQDRLYRNRGLKVREIHPCYERARYGWRQFQLKS